MAALPAKKSFCFASLPKRQLSRRGLAVWRTAKAPLTMRRTGFLSKNRIGICRPNGQKESFQPFAKPKKDAILPSKRLNLVLLISPNPLVARV
jgi:hypothetical protein